MPNIFFKKGMPLVGAILNGDGAHAVVFAFIPLFVLYAQAFMVTGLPAWGVMSVIGTAIIAIISPFAFFNLLILFTIITIAEGFLGGLRIKLARLLFLLISSFALSFFWYYPNVIGKIVILSHVKFTIERFWSAFPILIPIIPVLGSLSFLIFDRREKLQPIFIGLSLFLIYFFLFATSKSLNTTGIFVADRYLVELSFASSFLFSVLFVLLAEFTVRNYILKIKNSVLLFTIFFFISSSVVTLSIFSLIGLLNVQNSIMREPAINSYSSGIGAIKRSFEISPASLFADFISLATFIFLIFVIYRYSSISKIKTFSKEQFSLEFGSNKRDEK